VTTSPGAEANPLAHWPTGTAVPLVIGIDAGGTKSVCLLARADDGEIVGRGVGGPGNIRAVGEERVAQSLMAAIQAAFAAADRSSQQGIVAVVVGAAGAARADDRALVEAILRRAIKARYYGVTNDAAIALRAELPTGPGVLLISGTGSIGYGRTVNGDEVRAGGWGYLLDDAGSAYAVGLAGLAAILRAHDGRDPSTALRQPLLSAWDLTAPEEIISRLYQQPPPREAVAALGPIVFATARSGDAVAQQIVTAAGTALGDLAAATIRQLGTTPETIIPLVTDGGFLRAGADLLLPPLLATVQAHGLAVAQRTATIEAAHGAIWMARELA
jgi:N-acetylglucosamine kinase-like BadF-type ATPase